MAAAAATLNQVEGDPFNPQSSPFPLTHKRAEGSTESQIVTGGKYDDAMIESLQTARKANVDSKSIRVAVDPGDGPAGRAP